MPTYEYKCKVCGKKFELFHGIKEKPGGCTYCRSKRIERLISLPAGFILKGSGFYQTDAKKSVAKSDDSKSTEKKTGRKTKDAKADKKEVKDA